MSRLTRRTALLLPLAVPAAVGGCSWIDGLLSSNKPPLPGRRESIGVSRRGLEVAPGSQRPVTVPPAEANADWGQQGRTASHAGGNFAVSGLSPAWRSSIGEGGGYRSKITSTAVVAGGRVFTMDSDAAVSAFDLARGGRAWRTDTQGEKDRSTNVGGGIAVEGGVVYATTGRAEALALDAATGAIKWRKPLDSPGRSPPTVVGGRLFASTIDDRLIALNASDGSPVWTYQAATSATSVLGRPAPAVSDGFVVAGFGSGELVAVRMESGTLAWNDSLASARGRASVVDLSAIRGLPAVENSRVYATSLGNQTICLDLRSGRRLWERDAGGGEAPWLAGDWLYLVTSDQVLACLSRDDGSVRWISDLPRYETPEKQRDPIVWTGPVMAGGRLVLASNTQQAIAVDPADGRVLGQNALSDSATVPPIVAGGSVLFVTDDGSIQAFR